MKMPKKTKAPSRDFAQSAAVFSVVLGRPRNKRMIRFTMGPPSCTFSGYLNLADAGHGFIDPATSLANSWFTEYAVDQPSVHQLFANEATRSMKPCPASARLRGTSTAFPKEVPKRPLSTLPA